MIKYGSTQPARASIEVFTIAETEWQRVIQVWSNQLSERFHRSERLPRSVTLLIGFLLAAGAAIVSARDAKPRMVVPETSYDFGDIFVGQYMYHVFPIRNEGAVTLTLSDDVPGKPARPSPQASPAAGIYTIPHFEAVPTSDHAPAGGPFGVRRYLACRLIGALGARGARTLARDGTGDPDLAGPTTSAASPPGEPVPT
jgi:hypothetical protein